MRKIPRFNGLRWNGKFDAPASNVMETQRMGPSGSPLSGKLSSHSTSYCYGQTGAFKIPVGLLQASRSDEASALTEADASSGFCAGCLGIGAAIVHDKIHEC